MTANMTTTVEAASIDINGVSVFLPNTISGPGLPALKVGGVVDCLKGIPFPVQITDEIKAGKGELRISYTAGAVAAFASQDIGKVHHGHQGGGVDLSHRAAYYKIAVDYYQRIDGARHRLFDFGFNPDQIKRSQIHFDRASPDDLTSRLNQDKSEVDRQNSIPLATFLESAWSSAGQGKLINNFSADVVVLIVTRQRQEAEARTIREREMREQGERIILMQQIGRKMAPLVLVEYLRSLRCSDAEQFVEGLLPPLPAGESVVGSEIDVANMNEKERDAFLQGAIDAGRGIVVFLSGQYTEAAQSLARGIDYVSNNRAIAFKAGKLSLLNVPGDEEPAAVSGNKAPILFQGPSPISVAAPLPASSTSNVEGPHRVRQKNG